MKAEAEANADADREARDKVDQLNAADTLIFQTEKQLGEFGDKVPADKKSAIEAALTELKAVHQAQDLDKLEAATKALNDAWQAASQDIYQAQQEAGADATAGAGNEQGGNSAGSEDDVTDVEFEEVDEK